MTSTPAENQTAAPLEGIRVLDMGRYIAGPYCAALLGDMGAEVIRIEPPGGSADREVMQLGDAGFGAMHAHVNRGKKSLALASDTPAGRAVLERLIAQADILVINLAPERLRKLRLDFETLSAINPRLILCSISAYGYEGEYRNHSGFDTSGQALSGAMQLTGFGERPLRAAVSYVDYGTAMSAAYAALGALFARMRDGRGREVQSSLLATALTFMNPMLIEEATGTRSRRPIGNRSPIAGPSDLFRVADGWILVQIIGDALFGRWCDLVGQPELRDDPHFATDQLRGDNGEALSRIMADWCAQQSRQEALKRLEAARIPACPQLTPAEALHAPEITQGGLFGWQDKGELRYPVVAPVVRMADLPHPDAAPDVGADSVAVLEDYGFDASEIARFIEDGVVGASGS